MGDLTLDEATQKITDLEKRLEQSTASVAELTPRAAELDVVKVSEAKTKAELDALTTVHQSAQEQLKELETSKKSLADLQEVHTKLETRHTDSIKDRLKSFGLAEDKYGSRSLVELEAMESALNGYKPPTSSAITNSPSSPRSAGLESEGKEGDNNENNASPYAAELSEIDRARNRNNTKA